MPHIQFTKDTHHPRKRSINPDYQAGKIYSVSDEEARYFIDKGVATKFVLNIPKGKTREMASTFIKQLHTGLKEQEKKASGLQALYENAQLEIKRQKEKNLQDLLDALKLKPEPSKTLTTTPINDRELEEFRKYFATNTDITAKDLATMLLDVYTYSKDIRDNQTLSKVSSDLLTLYRLTKYFNNRNGNK